MDDITRDEWIANFERRLELLETNQFVSLTALTDRDVTIADQDFGLMTSCFLHGATLIFLERVLKNGFDLHNQQDLEYIKCIRSRLQDFLKTKYNVDRPKHPEWWSNKKPLNKSVNEAVTKIKNNLTNK